MCLLFGNVAILEWVIAFGYTFFLLTFFYDLRMAKGVHRGDLSRRRLINMQEAGVPVAAAVAGHEASVRASSESGPHHNIYPDGYSGGHSHDFHGGTYPNSVRTNGTAVSYAQQPPFASNGRGANTYAVNGYA